MNISDVATFFEYSYWARDRVLDACARLADGELDATPFAGLDSIRSILVHTMSAEWMWRMRWQGDSPRVRLSPADFPDLDAIVARWREEQVRMRAFVGGLRDEDLARECAYTMIDGTPLAEPLWQLVLHTINHGTQHRSEVAAILTALGQSPGELDMLGYFRALG